MSIDSLLNEPAVSDSANFRNSAYYYAKLEQAPDFSSIRQMYYHINDTYGYLENLMWQFIVYCGGEKGQDIPREAEQDINLSNQFFFKEKNTSSSILEQLRTAITYARRYATSTKSIDLVAAFEQKMTNAGSSEKLLEVIAKDNPPLVVLLVLKRFKYMLEEIELSVLNDLIKR